MTTYTIHIGKCDNPYNSRITYCATFDGYDGAPIDFETPGNDPVGLGETKYEAILDLLQNALDKGLKE